MANHKHRRARVPRDAFGLLPRADGSEAACPRGNRTERSRESHRASRFRGRRAYGPKAHAAVASGKTDPLLNGRVDRVRFLGRPLGAD
jgi:hypothetical protein